MQTVYIIIADNGDGSQRIEWYKGTEFGKDELIESASQDKYDSYASGDGVQLSMLRFPDSVDLNTIEGIDWCDVLPGVYNYAN